MATLEPRCQACGGKVGDRPATAALGPDGRTTWWLHRDAADCVQACRIRAERSSAERREVLHADAR